VHLDKQLLILLFLTFIINLVGSLAYSVRIAGVRTMRIAVSFSMFNILVLVSRTANTFQVPLMAKRVEQHLAAGPAGGIGDFRWLIASASAATIVGALLTPTFQRLFARASMPLPNIAPSRGYCSGPARRWALPASGTPLSCRAPIICGCCLLIRGFRSA